MGDDGVTAGAAAAGAVGAGAGAGIVGAATAAAAAVWDNIGGFKDTQRPLAGGVSGGFVFPSKEEIEGLQKMWQQRADSIAQRGAQLSEMVLGFTNARVAGDDSSTGYMREASQSIGLLQQQHDSMLKYIQDYIGKLEKAKQAKQTNEEETAKGIHKGTAGIDEK